MSQSWKSPVITEEHTNRAILGFFGPLSGKREFSQENWLCQFWVLMVTQLYAKYEKKLMSQPWKKGCRNVEAHKSRRFEPNLNRAIFGPILGERKFSPKISAPSVLSTYGP